MDKNIARAIIIATAVRAYDKRFGFNVYRNYVERALKATGLEYDENQIPELDKAESIYHISLLGLLNRWLKENYRDYPSQRTKRVPEDVLGAALEFLVKSAPAV